MKTEIVKATEIKVGDRMDFWGEINSVTGIIISPSGKTIMFKLIDDNGKTSETTWWRIKNTVNRLIP